MFFMNLRSLTKAKQEETKRREAELQLTRDELIAMAEDMGIWVEGRSMKVVDAGHGMSTLQRDRTITLAGERIIAFAEAVITETKRRNDK